MPAPSTPPALTLEHAETLIMHDPQVHQYMLAEERRRLQLDTNRVSGNPGAWHENLVTRLRFRCWIIRPDKPTGVCDDADLATAIVQAYAMAGFRPPNEIARSAAWRKANPAPMATSPFPPPPEKKKK